MDPQERKRSREPEEPGAKKQQRLDDSPISDHDLSIHVYAEDDDLLSSPVGSRGASVEQEFQLKPSPQTRPEATASDDSEPFPLSKGNKPSGEKRRERRYRGGAEVSETERHSSDRGRDRKGREKGSKHDRHSPARERERGLKAEGSRRPPTRGSPQYREGERSRREEREKRERIEREKESRQNYEDRAQRRTDDRREDQGRGSYPFDREEWSWERSREKDLLELPRRSESSRELGGRGRREARREKDYLREDRFDALLSRRSKSPRRLERPDRPERLDRPVKPVREPSRRGRDRGSREPADYERGRLPEKPGYREKHHDERERQLRREGRGRERERPSRTAAARKTSGSSDSDSESKRRDAEEEKIEDLIKEVEELEEEDDEGEEGEGEGETSSEQSSEEERGGSSGSETDSEGSDAEPSDGEIREKTRKKRKTLAKDVPEASDQDMESDNAETESRSPGTPPAWASLKRAHTEPVMRSKFDSIDDDDDDLEDQDRPARPVYKGYSGYEDRLGDSDVSDNDSTEEVERGKERKKGPLLKAPLLKTPSGLLKTPKDGSQMVEEPMEEDVDHTPSPPPLPLYVPALMGCRSVENYEWLNRIEEGTYGVVYRAKDRKSGEVVALKKLKMEKEKEGFPITSLREINMLLKARHPNIVHVREIVVGSNMDKIYIVMDYVEHDLKALMETMKEPFLQGEVKTLMLQLLRAVHHLHDNWILHRDLKASNLLLSHKGILKVGDFGLAREYGSPLRNYTPVVVTLWYRSPELLLGTKEYSTAVDMWSVGCIFAEFLLHKPLFRGKSEIDQLNQIFKELGTPNEEIWPGYSELPVAKKVTFTKQPYNNLRKKFPYLTSSGFDLLNRFLTYDPKKRITAEQALDHNFFTESPLPVDPSMFPTWPARSEGAHRPRERSPSAPEGGAFLLNKGGEDEELGRFRLTQAKHGQAAVGAGFSLKF